MRIVVCCLAVAAAIAAIACPPLPAYARTYPLAPGQTAIGDIGEHVTRYEDTLHDVARDNDLGFTQLVTANRGIDPWLPGAGKKIVLPQFYLLPDSPRRGLVINLAQHRAYYFPPGGGTVETYPIGVGVQGWVTPRGTTRIVQKFVHPGWAPPASIRREKPELPAYVPPGPDNPMGDYAMALGWRSYYIHGTNKPYGVGRNVSHGCIRFYPEDIERLFHEVSVGTPVHVTDEEVSAAWVQNRLYVAVFPNKEQTDQIDIQEPMTPMLPARLMETVRAAAGSEAERVDWELVRRLGMERKGIPTPVTGAGIATADEDRDGVAEDMSAVDRVIRRSQGR